LNYKTLLAHRLTVAKYSRLIELDSGSQFAKLATRSKHCPI
jgi:hypothetical protein